MTNAPTTTRSRHEARNLTPLLNHLISICKDGELGFRTAADDVAMPACKNLLLTYSQQRAEFARELQAAVRRLGAEPETEGSFVGLIHREWIDVKALVTERSMVSILEECARGEETALRAYSEALKRGLPPELESIVRRHHAMVETTYENLQLLREAPRTA
jgi:uncharacterized protein (TIGR02284 family)